MDLTDYITALHYYRIILFMFISWFNMIIKMIVIVIVSVIYIYIYIYIYICMSIHCKKVYVPVTLLQFIIINIITIMTIMIITIIMNINIMIISSRS